MTSLGRSLLFLVPGTTGNFFCGGLVAELKAMKLAQQVCQANVVTYREREPNTLFLPDLIQEGVKNDRIFVASWGFDVPKLIKQLKGHHVMYHAHSSSYGFRINSSIPILAVSRNTMGYWGQQSPHSLIYYLPNQISDEFSNHILNRTSNRTVDRDIDVLVQSRKSSSYLLNTLIPALQKKCRVQVITGFVDDLAALFNRSHVYLYDSAEYWAQQRVTEGFGLPPMEAMASGCHVFSSVNHALSDYLDPGFNCYKIAGYATGYDVQRILDCLTREPNSLPSGFLEAYRSDNIVQRWNVILKDVNQFFDYTEQHGPDIVELTPLRVQGMRWRSNLGKVKKRLMKR